MTPAYHGDPRYQVMFSENNRRARFGLDPYIVDTEDGIAFSKRPGPPLTMEQAQSLRERACKYIKDQVYVIRYF